MLYCCQANALSLYKSQIPSLVLSPVFLKLSPKTIQGCPRSPYPADRPKNCDYSAVKISKTNKHLFFIYLGFVFISSPLLSLLLLFSSVFSLLGYCLSLELSCPILIVLLAGGLSALPNNMLNPSMGMFSCTQIYSFLFPHTFVLLCM
jgi:hypothetical protein